MSATHPDSLRHDRVAAEFAALRPRLVSTALAILRDLDEAEDAVQDAYLSAWRALGEFRAEARLSTWIYRIVVNACLMRIRKRRRRPDIVADVDALPPRGSDLGREVEARDLLNCVFALADRLSRVQRSALLRVVATELGGVAPPDSDAEKMRRHRARAVVRELLGGLKPV